MGLEGRGFSPAGDNHPGAQGAAPPESGGEFLKNFPPQMRRGGAPSAGVVAKTMLGPVRGAVSLTLSPWRHFCGDNALLDGVVPAAIAGALLFQLSSIPHLHMCLQA